MITFEEIKKDPGIRTYIQKADESLINLGFTEHSFAHVGLVAANSKYILETLGYTPREVELVQIAAYLHDIGNLVNRIDHSQSGAVMACWTICIWTPWTLPRWSLPLATTTRGQVRLSVPWRRR